MGRPVEMTRLRACVKGFTFLEVMAALAIVSGLVVTILAALSANLGAARRLDEEVTAAGFAWGKLEDAKLSGCIETAGTLAGGRFKWSCLEADEPHFKGLGRLSVAIEWEGKAFKLNGYRKLKNRQDL